MIEGGAARGSSLLHSFQTFSIDAGQAVYFANPAAIANILARVAGGDLSLTAGHLHLTGLLQAGGDLTL